MSRASTVANRQQRKAKTRKRSRRPTIPPLAVLAGVIVLLAVVATLLSQSGGSSDGDGGRTTAAVSISGGSLPDYPRGKTDTAVGMTAPVLTGIDFDGKSVEIRPNGKPVIVVLLAHWCPHCRNDVPDVQTWIDENGMPPGVDVYAISTWVDKAKANYPPAAWLKREGWTVPTLVDDANSSAAKALGLQATPFWIAIGADGKVISRVETELGGAGLAQLAARITQAAA